MHRTSRRGASAAAALVALLLIAAPVWAARPPDAGSQGSGNAGGNQGAVKVVDAETGLESTTNNEPHVCGFLLHFSEAPNGESGAWAIVDWPPTGNGNEVASGTYAIPPGGAFVTATMQLDAGHYRVNWQAVNAQTEKHKTFWVDSCEADTAEEEQTEEQPEESPEDQVEESLEESPTNEQPEEQVEESLEESPTNEQPEEQVEESLEELPTEEPPEEQLQEGTDTEQPADPEDGLAPSISDEPLVDELPDTAMDAPVLPGLGAAMGILVLVIAHRTIVDRGRRPAPTR